MILEETPRLRVSRQRAGVYMITLSILERRVAAHTFTLRRSRHSGPSDPAWKDAGALNDLVFQNIGERVAAAMVAAWSAGPILLTLGPRELWPLPWEALAELWPLNATPQYLLGHRFIVRYSGYRGQLALVPLAMPLTVAMVGDTEAPSAMRDRFEKYYQTTEQTTSEGLADLLQRGQFDIVHLNMEPIRDSLGRLALGRGSRDSRSGEPVPVSQLRRGLRASSTRLLVLEGSPGSREALLEVAHSTLGRVGPSVIVTEGGGDFGAFYYDILHNPALDDLVTARLPHAALLTTRYGTTALDLERVATSIRADAESAHAAVERALDAYRSLDSPSALPPDSDRRLAAATVRLDSMRTKMFSYNKEIQGVVPMTEATEQYAQVVDEVQSVVQRLGRVVNTWFESDGEALPMRQSLEPGGGYELKINVGLPAAQSIVATPVPIDESYLASKYEEGSVPLRVIVSGRDFTVEPSEQVLRVAEPPAGSATISFLIRAPKRSGPARLRIGLYHRNNLLQSLLVTADIGTAQSAEAGHSAEIEWAMTGTLGQLDRFQPRAFNLLMNESPDGDHVFLIVGDDARRELVLEDSQLKNRIGAVRTVLQGICSTLNSEGQPDQYRFGSDNRGSERKLLDDLKELANVGYGLYAELEGNDEAWSAKLKAGIARPTAIQVAGVKSADYTFPWSAVYDHRFIKSSKNRLCPEVASALKAGLDGSALARVDCFARDCAHRDDTAVVCPSGFWGMRHVIEQPLSAGRDDGDPLAVQAEEVAFSIPAPSGHSARAAIALSENLRDWRDHGRDASAVLFNAVGTSDLDQIGTDLRSLDLQVAYFFCHGGRAAGEAWLGVGTRRQPEKIYPQNFKAWQLKWPTVRPLVFINGCKTVGLSPDDLLSFNRTLAWCRASGVIGAEITIPETLAKWFGLAFLKAFLAGREVGQIMRTLRLDLLARYNPLGLGYTPYCVANLHLEV